MNEKKPRFDATKHNHHPERANATFRVRELVWLSAVVALGAGWFRDHENAKRYRESERLSLLKAAEAETKARQLEAELDRMRGERVSRAKY